MKVVLSGLTASGKSTTAKAVADWLEIPLVSGSELRREFLGLSDEEFGQVGRQFWLSSGQALRADSARLEVGASEPDFDERLNERHDFGGPGVFDVWFLGWLARTPSLRIWLDAPIEVRAQRALRDPASAPLDPARDLRRAIEEKDARSGAYARQRYGLDIFADRRPFQIVFDTSSLESELLGKAASFLTSIDFGRHPPALTSQELAAVNRAVVKCPPPLRDRLQCG